MKGTFEDLKFNSTNNQPMKYFSRTNVLFDSFVDCLNALVRCAQETEQHCDNTSNAACLSILTDAVSVRLQ